MRLPILGLLLGLLSFVSALSAAGSKLLVIIEDDADKSKYTQFWTDLENRGFQITYRGPKDSSLSLFEYGLPAYSHLLLLPVKAKGLGPALTPNLLVDFVNGGSNILLALSAEQAIPSAISSLLLEMDINLPADRTSVVVDHFNHDSKSAAEKHDVLLLPAPTLKQNVKDFFSVDGLIAFPHAVGQVLGNASPLLSSVVKAPSTAYVYNPKDDSEAAPEDLFATGSQINVVSAFQARNSARFTVLGSAEALEDKWFDASVQLPGAGKKAEKSSNKAFAEKLSAWTFKELGVLKVGSIKHYLNEGSQKNIANTSEVASLDLNPTIYRIKNDVHYEIEVSEWDIDHWAPFNPPAGDNLQLEFSMLSPFHRLNLQPKSQTANSTIYTQEFRTPDQHGIFNFFVEYRRPFYTNVEEKVTVTVRHFAHDEWPRSYAISAAWPWISGIWVTVGGWIVFVAVWLYSAPKEAKAKTR
ncbi:Dolichyl-diphosphooligosaccharide--protein glycosyltransferase subunit wbp1 [Pseudocercospora fuligena]|uniref:Dolichyl-diphosphooligosaccharide--protein glycosyltransferase subunit WBP1 n=1 Tax=Pseudocercospora fuligena TaxID=685502 RepID=A0A8H6RHP4_9PEZI|nr:Dolichyl-diphosphooligosaccharide--protein glycosyltransferase subunit wbp1 [Pseudocercospora fuligena]